MRTKLILPIAAALILYLAGPLIAGLFGVGERDGPRIYPREYHTALYMTTYEMMRNEKPRLSIEAGETERPLFYGLPRTRR
jgi:hypothetical protein